MAAPVYATDLADVVTDMASTTGWTALGGGAGGLVAPETDFFIQGANCISKAGWSAAEKGTIFNFGSGITVPTDGAVVFWLYFWAPNALGNVGDANGGLNALIGSATTAYKIWHMGGADTLPYAGWLLASVDPAVTQDRTTGSPSATLQYFGSLANVPAGGPSKGQPLGVDAIRYGRVTLTSTEGDSGSGFATFEGAATYDANVTRRWGHILKRDGAYFVQGFLSFGSVSTAVDFRDSNRVIFVRDTPKVTAAFNRFEVLHASSNVEWTSISISALGTNSKGTLVVTSGLFTASNCTFTDMNTFTLLSTSTASACTFRRCGQIVAPGSDLTGSQVDSYTGAADTSAVVWDVATDVDGLLDDTTFIKGTNAHHAIELGTTSPTSVTLRGIAFVGFNAADAQNDSTIYVKRTTGSVTISTVGCSGNITYKTDGATVSIVPEPVTLTVKCVDGAGIAIQDVQVSIHRTDTGVELMNELTNASGVATESFNYLGDTPVRVRARKSSSGTKYIPETRGGTISSAGLSVQIDMRVDTVIA
jgi:hypothetical protein